MMSASAPVNNPPIRVFDIAGGSHSPVGLLSRIEMVARKGGDAVSLNMGHEQNVLLLSGATGAYHFARQASMHPAQRGDVTSDGVAVRRLLGDSTLAEAWRAGKLSIDRHLPSRLEQARAEATAALLQDTLQANDTTSLRVLCRLWSIRACGPALLGSGFAESTLAEGLLLVETFFTRMNGIGARTDTADTQRTFKQARAFLDEVLATALASNTASDDAVSCLRALLPVACGKKDAIDILRPVVFGLLFEAVQIDGLNLLWTLLELGRAEAIADTLAAEAATLKTEQSGPFARATAMEALRLYPELPLVRRNVSPRGTGAEDGDGSIIVYAPWLIHRDARLWPRPASFLPQRFLPDAGTASLPDIYMPFGLGLLARRRTEFVISQIAATITTICMQARFSLAPSCRPGDLRPVYHATLQPRGNVNVRWTSRGDSSARNQS